MADFNEEQLKRISFHLLTFKNPKARQHVLRNQDQDRRFFPPGIRGSSKLTGLFPDEIKAVRERNWAAAEKKWPGWKRTTSRSFSADDEDYPPLLAEIYDPPDLIYFTGNRELLAKTKAGRGRFAARQRLRPDRS